MKKQRQKSEANKPFFRFSFKHFLIGAGIALLPVLYFGFNILKPEGSKTLAAIASKREIIEYERRLALLKLEYSSLPTATPIPTSTPKPSPVPTKPPVKMTASLEIHRIGSPAEIQALIDRYSAQYGVSREIMTIIAKCESGFRANAVSGPYAGIYQFIASTWSSNRRAMGMDPNPDLRFNAEEAVRTAAFKMSRDGYGAWPACSRKAYSQLGYTP